MRIRCVGHVKEMGKMRNIYETLDKNPSGKMLFTNVGVGRRKYRNWF
jgi:hypothetical protein